MTHYGYSHTWRSGPKATMHALVMTGGLAPGVACNKKRVVASSDGEHYDYRISGGAIGSPSCQTPQCQALFRDPEGVNDHGF